MEKIYFQKRRKYIEKVKNAEKQVQQYIYIYKARCNSVRHTGGRVVPDTPVISRPLEWTARSALKF